MKRKILIVELWGLGDLSFSTPVIATALAQGDELHLLGKGHAKTLLEPTYPEVKFTIYEAPWTVYKGKYKLWKWKWSALLALLKKLRAENFDIAVSARDDPRDQLLMWIIGAKKRVGFVFEARRRFDAGWLFLTQRLKRPKAKQHKVEDWYQIGAALDLPAAAQTDPRLDRTRYGTSLGQRLFANPTKPVVVLHTGARIPVRRWPEKYYGTIMAEMRKKFDFHLIVIPEPQVPPPPILTEIADAFVNALNVREMVDLLGRADLVICNDSGPGHIAASCGRPVITVFGPSDPDWFRPWGDASKVIIRDICEWRPCFDYCHFSEPHCMTKLLPENVWPEIEAQIRALIASGKLTDALLGTQTRNEVTGV